jgi:hypothetical protein
VYTELTWLSTGSNGDFYEHGHETSGSINGTEFLDQLFKVFSME